MKIKLLLLLMCVLFLNSFVYSENSTPTPISLHLDVDYRQRAYIPYAEPILGQVGDELFFGKNQNFTIREMEPNFIYVGIVAIIGLPVGKDVWVSYELYKNNQKTKTILRWYQKDTAVKEIVKEVNNMAYDYYINN